MVKLLSHLFTWLASEMGYTEDDLKEGVKLVMKVLEAAEVKEILQDYVLITYDIPAKDWKTRANFIRKARSVGAMMYTASCWLLPYSEAAFELANEVAASGNAIVWRSHQADKKKAAIIMTTYEQHLEARCEYIEQRLQRAVEYMTMGKLWTAARMGIKTGELLKELAQIAEHFGKDWLKERLAKLVADWKGVYGDKGKQK